jgi:hypothetical protein
MKIETRAGSSAEAMQTARPTTSSWDRLLSAAGIAVMAIALVSFGLAVWLHTLNPPTGQSAVGGGSILAAMVAYVVVGGFLVHRRPHNLVGWLILSVGFFGGSNTLATEYARYGLLTTPGSLPFASFWAWYGAWSFEPVLAVPAFLLVLYPDGRLISKRWRILAFALVAVVTANILPYALEPSLELGQSDWHIRYPNPIGIPGSGHLMNSILGWSASIGGPLFLVSLLYIFIRYRKSSAVERLQIKWFAYSALAAIVLIVALSPVPVLTDVAFGLGLSVLPIATLVAIQRYRLYDIDRLINRTIVYVVVVALLLGCYLAVVLLVSTLSPLSKDSPAVVAVSTLAAAALFRPLLARVRAFIDRRFNRARYDAQQTLESFSSRLRNEVDIDSLSRQLIGVVHTTMEPNGVGLWLREM